jgi:1-aminocyclopropane-1-carboxylate deaminase/D-cysteine desulfhydrase-like pyridoxal-dependent ACC family enzyme
LESLSRRTGSDLWVKRDDESSERYGGNKVRKLESTLGEAREKGAVRVLTIGAAGSHHVLATGLYARMLGLATTAVLVPQPPTTHVARNVLAGLGAGIELVGARSDAEGAVRFAALAASLALRDGVRPYLLAVGGSSASGTIGYVDAAFELAAQVRAGEMPMPDEVWVPLGSGATVAGLLLGTRLAALETRVVGVRVTGGPFSSRPYVTWLARRALARLRQSNAGVPEVAPGAFGLEEGHIGEGYGHPTPAGEEATRLAEGEGLSLDPTYTAKTFAAFLAAARARPGRTLLYWHTLSSADVSDLVEAGRASPIPPVLRRYVG